MKLEPLYRVRFGYTDGWTFPIRDGEVGETFNFFLADGRCEGRICGRFRGANHPLRRSDGTYQPDFQGVIETEDGATIYFDHMGYGRAYPKGRRQIVSSGIHVSDDERYAWLNDKLAVGVGEVRSGEGPSELVVDFYDLGWEPLPESWPPTNMA